MWTRRCLRFLIIRIFQPHNDICLGGRLYHELLDPVLDIIKQFLVWCIGDGLRRFILQLNNDQILLLMDTIRKDLRFDARRVLSSIIPVDYGLAKGIRA